MSLSFFFIVRSELFNSLRNLASLALHFRRDCLKSSSSEDFALLSDETSIVVDVVAYLCDLDVTMSKLVLAPCRS